MDIDINALRGGYTDEQLKEAFDKVKNREHWKDRINAVVGEDEDLDLISFAVGYYTGGVPTISRARGGGYRVRARGYWACVGA